MADAGRVAVVVPAFNAAAGVASVVAAARAAVPQARVIVVDDGSTDDTASRAGAAGADVLRHEANLGKGRALSTGIAAACRWGAAALATLDADGQHPPGYLPALLGPALDGSADLVIGARKRAGTMPAHRRLTNRVSSALVSRATGLRVDDSQCGFRAMTAQVARAVRPGGNRYEYETEFLLEAAALGFRIRAVEIPTVYAGQTSHFRHGADTLAIAAVFLRHWRAIITGPQAA
jgi:glycosyltransferase involved in cell wall biosynthesis